LQEPRLTPTSYIVLGMIEMAGEATPYDLKRGVSVSLGNFWSLQHAQLYSEPERLAKAGYLKERREEGGRRRRHYSITRKGRDVLAEWRDTPPDKLFEIRDLGLLKLFFGADPAMVADAQLEAHKRKLAELETYKRLDFGEEPRGPWLTLDAGIRHEHTAIEYWEGVRKKRRRSRRG
jgi:PadR family transcriptional regulator, regulatory protein AphA